MTDNGTNSAELYARSDDKPRWRDIALILAITALVISIGVHAPGHSYSYAQMRQMGATVGMIESGNWLLPHNHEGQMARKPQLYSWLTAPVLMATGSYTDFVFRWPSVAAALGCGALAYLLGLAWFGRRVGLMAAILWATSLHMGKLMYLGTTDMLNTFWLMAAVLCADHILWVCRPSDPKGRRLWVIGLWFSIIMGAMTKGWGVANLPLIGGWLIFTTGLAPGFKPIASVQGFTRKTRAVIALVWGRWRAAAKRIRLFWGILAFAAVLGPIWGAMFYVGGEEFQGVLNREIWKRIFGGYKAPKPSSAPTLLWLLFYTLPGSALAIGALSSTRIRKCLSLASPAALPLWWIIAVALPFSMAHGFRPDYLLPCYISVAILAAWGVDRLAAMDPKESPKASLLRHLLAFVVISVCLFTVIVPLLYLWHERLPAFVSKAVRMPSCVAPETWWILAALSPLGAVLIVAAVRASLRWRIRALAAILVPGMLCVLFIDRHMISRHARTGAGQTLIKFAEEAKKVIGDDDFAVCRAEKLGAELYWGRFGTHVTRLSQLKSLDDNIRWLVTNDRGLSALGACVRDPEGRYAKVVDQNDQYVHMNRGQKRPAGCTSVKVRPIAELAGEPIDLNINGIIDEDNMGRLYLIRLHP